MPEAALGLAVAQARRTRLAVVAPQKNSATYYPELAKLEIVTERTGHPQDGGVVLAWCPTYKVMEKLQHLKKSAVVLVEWIPGEFEAWAKLRGAYNVVTGEVMNAGLSEDALKALERVVYEGYNAWHDDIAMRMTRSCLEDLAKAGAYDRELVLAYARQSKSETSIERLNKVLDKFEASRTAGAEGANVRVRTSREW